MLAYRWTCLIKHGRMQEMLELHTSLPIRPIVGKVRWYTPDISPQLWVTELVVQDEEEMRKFFDEFNATPEAAPFWGKFNALVEQWVSTERWNVTDYG
jgi:hypothetical protein